MNLWIGVNIWRLCLGRSYQYTPLRNERQPLERPRAVNIWLSTSLFRYVRYCSSQFLQLVVILIIILLNTLTHLASHDSKDRPICNVSSVFFRHIQSTCPRGQVMKPASEGIKRTLVIKSVHRCFQIVDLAEIFSMVLV